MHNAKTHKPNSSNLLHKQIHHVIAGDLSSSNSASPLPMQATTMFTNQPFIISPQPLTMINMNQPPPPFFDQSPVPQLIAVPALQQRKSGSSSEHSQKSDKNPPLATPVWSDDQAKNEQFTKHEEFVLLYPDPMANIIQTHVLPAYHSPIPFHILGPTSSPLVRISPSTQFNTSSSNLQKVSLENRLHQMNSFQVPSPQALSSDSKSESVQRGSSLQLMKTNVVEANVLQSESTALAGKESFVEAVKPSRRKRSALRSDLIFCGLYNDPETEDNCNNRRPAKYEAPQDYDDITDENENNEVNDIEEISNSRTETAAESSLSQVLKTEEEESPSSDPQYSRIRVWIDKERKTFFDCTCGKRKPTQDLKKILRHIEGHSVSTYPCEVCGRVFKHHLGRNSHQRVHKDKQ
jgi:hypothetical protein